MEEPPLGKEETTLVAMTGTVIVLTISTEIETSIGEMETEEAMEMVTEMTATTATTTAVMVGSIVVVTTIGTTVLTSGMTEVRTMDAAMDGRNPRRTINPSHTLLLGQAFLSHTHSLVSVPKVDSAPLVQLPVLPHKWVLPSPGGLVLPAHSQVRHPVLPGLRHPLHHRLRDWHLHLALMAAWCHRPHLLRARRHLHLLELHHHPLLQNEVVGRFEVTELLFKNEI